MPTVTIDITKVSKLSGQNKIVEIEAVQGDNSIIRTIDLDDYSTWEEFAGWLINQTPDRTSQPDWLRSLEIDWHSASAIDPDSGSVITWRVVDNVTVNPLA